jgi:hypothetical protein
MEKEKSATELLSFKEATESTCKLDEKNTQFVKSSLTLVKSLRMSELC